MALVARSLQAPLRPDGTAGTRQGVLIVGPQVTWASGTAINAALNLLNRPNGTAISEDIRVHASGAGAGGTLSLQQVANDDYSAIGGFSISTDDIVSAAGSNGAGVMRANINYSGVDYPSPNIDWSVVTAQPPDILAPTQPLIKTITAPTSSTLQATLQVPVDPKSPTSDADGLVSIAVERALGAGSYSLVETINVSPGLSLQYVATNIGSVSPAPSVTQTGGANWQVTAAGRSDSTSDSISYTGATVTGDFQAVVRVKSFTGVIGATSFAGLMARSSNNADAQFAMCVSMCDSGTGVNDAVKAEYRSTIGGAKQSTAAKLTGITGDRLLHLTRTGDLFTKEWSQDGTADRVFIGSQTIAMGESCEIGMVVSSQVVGTEVTAIFERLAVQNLADVVHNSSGLADDSIYNVRSRATDGTNVGSYSPIRSVTTPPAAPGANYEDILSQRVGYASFYDVTGGQGRQLVTVTNTNASGSGSFASVVNAISNGAWVIFSQGLTGTITLNSTVNIPSNVTIDGRGANITIQGPGGSSSTLNISNGARNIILMYIKVVGPIGNNNDLFHVDNSEALASNLNNSSELLWVYHCNFKDAEDEVVSFRHTRGRFTIQESYMENKQGTGYTVLMLNNGINGGSSAWDQVVRQGTFYRNYFNGDARIPRLACASNFDLVNNYCSEYHEAAIFVLSFVNGLKGQARIENNIFSPEAGGGSKVAIDYTQTNWQTGEGVATGNLALNGATNVNLQNNPGSVFTRPYSLSIATATTALRDDIIATAGWQNVTNPAH